MLSSRAFLMLLLEAEKCPVLGPMVHTPQLVGSLLMKWMKSMLSGQKMEII